MQSLKHIRTGRLAYEVLKDQLNAKDRYIFDVHLNDAKMLVLSKMQTSKVTYYEVENWNPSTIYHTNGIIYLSYFASNETIMVAPLLWRELQQKFPTELICHYFSDKNNFYKRGPGIKFRNYFVMEAIINAFSLEQVNPDVVGINKNLLGSLNDHVRRYEQQSKGIL